MRQSDVHTLTLAECPIGESAKTTVTVLSIAAALLSGVVFTTPIAIAAETRLVNLDSAGNVPARVGILGNAQSNDGRFIAFLSDVPYTDNPATLGANIFVRDMATGLVEQVSVSSDGTPGNMGTISVHMSDDGRYVAFESFSSNLVDDDTNIQLDVFLHDRQTGQTLRVNEGPNGEQTTRRTQNAGLSGDGSTVSFETNATEILGIDDNTVDMFVFDATTGAITEPNYDADGNRRAFSIRGASLSYDGNEISLNTSTSFDPRHLNSTRHIYVLNKEDDTFELISLDSNNQASPFGASNQSAISGNGRYVAYATFSRLLPSDTDNTLDITVIDRSSGQIWNASVNDMGAPIAAQPFQDLAISDDGQSVLFRASAPEFSVLATNAEVQVYLYDHATGKTELISQNNQAEPSEAPVSPNLSISAHARYVLFESAAGNLDPLSEAGTTNLFRRDRGASCGTVDAPLNVTLPRNQWFQLSLPCEPPSDANTVQDVLGDDITGTYEESWIAYVYDDADGQNAYRVLALDEPMTPGQGFWFAHLTDDPVTLDMPVGSRGFSTNLDAGELCVSLIGCHPLPLSGQNSDGVRWNMVGNPFPHPQGFAFDDLRLSANEGPCAAASGCTLLQAAEANVAGDTFYSWNGSAYDTVSSGATITPWAAAWLDERPGTVALDPVLYVPE